MLALALFGASFLFVFLKAFQQRNVAFDNYALIMPFSFGMAATEVFVIASIATTGASLLAIFAIGLGGGLGCIAGMWGHKRFAMKDDA